MSHGTPRLSEMALLANLIEWAWPQDAALRETMSSAAVGFLAAASRWRAGEESGISCFLARHAFVSNGDMDSRATMRDREKSGAVPISLIFLTGAISASIMRASISFTGTVQWRYIHGTGNLRNLMLNSG